MSSSPLSPSSGVYTRGKGEVVEWFLVPHSEGSLGLREVQEDLCRSATIGRFSEMIEDELVEVLEDELY